MPRLRTGDNNKISTILISSAIVGILSFMVGGTSGPTGRAVSPELSPHLLILVGGIFGAALGAIVAFSYIVERYGRAMYATFLWGLFTALAIAGRTVMIPFKVGLGYGAIIGVTFVVIVSLSFMTPGSSDDDLE